MTTNSKLSQAVVEPVTAADIDLVIMTVARDVNYLPQTLASLYLADPLVRDLRKVHLVLGSPDTRHVDELTHHGQLAVHRMSGQDWQKIKDWRVHQRLAFNYWRCLTLPDPGPAGVCICEDDIIFRDGFVTKLLQTINEMRADGLHRYLLAAYSHYDYAADSSRRRGRYYCSYNASTHYGNCCIFFSPATRTGAAEAIYRRSVDPYESPADLVLGDYGESIWQQGTGGMYQTVCSLAQHIGRVSGGTSAKYFCSPTFDLPWPPQPIAASDRGAATTSD